MPSGLSSSDGKGVAAKAAADNPAHDVPNIDGFPAPLHREIAKTPS
jgi:hypothetical protein